MEHTAEQYFIQTLIRKNRRDRLLFELRTVKRRYDGLSRFCHQSEKLLDPAKVVLSGADLEFRPDFLRFTQQHNESCLILSPDPGMDNQTMQLEDAIRMAAGFHDAVIIIGNTFAIVFGEPVKGGRDKFLLSE
jgi:hypothetical protein